MTKQEMKKAPSTLYVNLYYNDGKLAHTATIRSDWDKQDYETLSKMFPNCYIKTTRMTIPVGYLGDKWHNTDFASLRRLQLC